MKAKGKIIRNGRRVNKFAPAIELCLFRYLAYLSHRFGGEWSIELRYKSLPRKIRLHNWYLDEWENLRKSFTTYDRETPGYPRTWLASSNGLTRNAYFNGNGWRKVSRRKDLPPHDQAAHSGDQGAV